MQASRLGAVIDCIHVRAYGTRECQALEFGQNIEVLLETPDDCDEVIRAAREAKSAMTAARRPSVTCSERTCDAKHPDTGDWCVKQGAHAEHEDTYGQTWTTEPDTLAKLKPVLAAGGWCMASTSPREGLTVHCDLPRGHDGRHCSPGWDEGEPDTTWSSESAQVSA